MHIALDETHILHKMGNKKPAEAGLLSHAEGGTAMAVLAVGLVALYQLLFLGSTGRCLSGVPRSAG